MNAQAAAYILFPDNSEKSKLREARIDLAMNHASTPIWDEVQFLFWQDHFGRWDRDRLLHMARLLSIPHSSKWNTGTLRANMIDWWTRRMEELSKGVR